MVPGGFPSGEYGKRYLVAIYQHDMFVGVNGREVKPLRVRDDGTDCARFGARRMSKESSSPLSSISFLSVAFYFLTSPAPPELTARLSFPA